MVKKSRKFVFGLNKIIKIIIVTKIPHLMKLVCMKTQLANSEKVNNKGLTQKCHNGVMYCQHAFNSVYGQYI